MDNLGRVDALGLPEVAGSMMDRSIADFVRACRTLIRDEQEKPNPDTALVGVLCDAVRLTRELDRVIRAGITIPPVACQGCGREIVEDRTPSPAGRSMSLFRNFDDLELHSCSTDPVAQ